MIDRSRKNISTMHLTAKTQGRTLKSGRYSDSLLQLNKLKASDPRSEVRLARLVIRQTIKDLGNGDYASTITAKRYIRSEVFSVDRINAGYPPELLDTLKGMVLLSKPERKYLSQKILKFLHENWEKKTQKKPPKDGG